MEVARSGIVTVHGLNYKDRPADAAAWLDELGDPYTRTGADVNGRVAIDWGVYGVPETFVVDSQGTIAHKHIGPVTPAAWNDELLPLIRKLQAASSDVPWPPRIQQMTQQEARALAKEVTQA